ncbi:MAG: HYR domain-containing protein, partial [Prolixibacteraceae bacterium]|nr:HYR domain-containing protein [Prolixibacteraceae bacterium]
MMGMLGIQRKGHFFIKVVLLLLVWSLVSESSAQTSQTFTSSGNFRVPAGVTAVTVECWGGGGAGGGQNRGSDGGGGGGGGAYSRKLNIPVAGGGNYSVTVGAGGTGVAGSKGNNGGDSYFISRYIVLAKGGIGGRPSTGTPPPGGAGGDAANCVGDIMYSGGQGEIGRDNSYGQGGYGGSSAGYDEEGWSGEQYWVTTEYPWYYTPFGGGDGGNGGAVGQNGNAGYFPGGGGGGSGEGRPKTGGNGAGGQVVITWLIASAEATETCVGGSTGTIWVTASGGDTPYSYRLNGGYPQSDNLFFNLAAGTYTVTVSDQIGRTTDISVVVGSPSPSGDNQLTSGTNYWMGHVYKRLDAVSSPPSESSAFSDYYGILTEPESFDESFGGTNNCISVAASESDRAVYSEFFAVRFRMNSTRRGLYTASLGSDDGSRLTVDGNPVYNNWGEQGFAFVPDVLFSLTGSSSLVYDFYESTGGNRVAFRDMSLMIENVLSVNTSQNICQGNSGAEISGDALGYLPSGITASGSGYQWAYSTSPGGPWADIPGATAAEFTPSAMSIPFRTPGTYYLVRKVILASRNNISPDPYLATNLSNVVSVTVIETFPVSVSISASATAVCEGTNVIFTATPANGGTSPGYQWYKGTNPISGATGSTYSSANLVDNDVISVKMTSDLACTTGNPAESNSIVLKVDAVSVGGTLTSDQVVCYNSAPADIVLSGNTGNVVKWQKSADEAFTSPVDIAVTSQTLTGADIGPLASKTFFRAMVKNGACNPVYSSVVTVSIETTPPVFSGCLSDMTRDIDPGMCSALVSWTIPTATDNCGSSVTTTVSSSAGEEISLAGGKHQATIAAGTSVITYTAFDAAGNTATCSFRITVKDLTAPSLTSPPDQSVFCINNIPDINTLAAFEAAGGRYSDNAGSQCNSLEIGYSDVLSGSVVTRTYTVKDGGLNMAACQQKFTVISPPQLTISSLGFDNTCPGDELTIQSDVSGYGGAVHYQWQLKVHNSSLWTVVGGDSPTFSGVLGSLGDEYRLLVSQTTDFNGAGCNAVSNVLRLVDVTKPVFTEYAPASRTICTENGAGSVRVADIRLNHEDVADNCTGFDDLDVSYT